MSKEGEHSHTAKDYVDPPPAPIFDLGELKLWSFHRALIAEFVATLLFLYVTVATVIGHSKQPVCGGVGLLGIAWAFGGMIFILVYCTAGISGGHINPAVTFGLLLARKVSLVRAVLYMVAQCLGAICGVGLVKAIMKTPFNTLGGGANYVHPGYSKGTALGAEIIGTFVLVYTVSRIGRRIKKEVSLLLQTTRLSRPFCRPHSALLSLSSPISMSSAWAPLPLRQPVVIHSRAQPPPRSCLLVNLQDIAGHFNVHGHHTVRLISPSRKIDSASVPSLSRNNRRLSVRRRGGVCFATENNDIASQARDADSSVVMTSATDESPTSDAQPTASDLSKTNSSGTDNTSKRAPLTAREKLRAARVLSRYTESKVSKSRSGSKILDALQESDKGKRKSGLPEAPVDLFDDSKRGMPKPGWTFDFPGGSDLLVIAFSFVFISTVMFGTTYIVWKVGAIHFNEY